MSIKKITAIIILFKIFAFTCLSQSNIDSLENILRTSKNDTNKVKLIYKLGKLYRNIDNSKAILYFNASLKLSDSLSYKNGVCEAYHGLGVMYSKEGNYNKSIEYYFKGLKIAEETGNTKEVVVLLNNLGINYNSIHKYDDAKKYLFQSLLISEKNNYKFNTSNILNSIGMVYDNKSHDSARYFYQKSLAISREIKDTEGIANTLFNIGVIFGEDNQNDSALVYFKNTLKVYTELGHDEYFPAINNNIGDTYNKMKDFKKAIKYANDGILVAQNKNLRPYLTNLYSTLSDAYYGLGDYKKAYEYKTKFSDIKDTILNEENSKIVSEMSARFQTEKKQKEIENLTQKNQIQDLDLKKKQLTIYYSFTAGFLILILSIVIYNRYRIKQKANNELTIKNKIIEDHQKEIIDSFNYARRIQRSLLPTDSYIDKNLKRLNKS